MAHTSIAQLKFSERIYPRHMIDKDHVRHLVQARINGATFPPIVADRATRTITDGVHRVEVVRVTDGENGQIDVEWREYDTEGEMFLDAVRLNARHGKSLSSRDRAVIFLKGASLHLDRQDIAGVVGVSLDRADKFIARRTAWTSDETPVTLPLDMRRLAGEVLTSKQVAAAESGGGMNPVWYVNRLITLIEADCLNLDDMRTVTRLRYLHALLGRLDLEIPSIAEAA